MDLKRTIFGMLGLWLTLLSGALWANEETPPALTPQHTGYAFDQPDILVRQRLFGLAHGVHLLVSACLGKRDTAAATQTAYDVWHANQHATLTSIRAALAHYYFAEHAARAYWQDIANALGLKETIHPSLGGVSLDDACASLPASLQNERYDLAQRLRLANSAVPPAPTFNKTK
jgi:hypothetical protein